MTATPTQPGQRAKRMSHPRPRIILSVAVWLGIGVAVAAGLTGCGSSAGSTPASGAVSVRISAPSDGRVVSTDRITVRGTVTPANAAVQVVGQSAQVGQGVFTASTPLQPGANQIDILASAPGQAPSSTTITVTRRNTGSTAPATKPSDPGASSSGSSSSGTTYNGTACGGGVVAGPNTSCPFAQNVVATYNQTGGGTVSVYSPVTNQTYSMSCTSSPPHVCTGANNASVYFP
jgi:hypothetical protein